jgi:hypothetical protein
MPSQGSPAPAIYYLCPDTNVPSGGVRRIYRHVEILARHGFTTAVVHGSPAFRPGWFSSDAPVSEVAQLPAPRDLDVLVLPEVCHQAIIAQRDANYRRVVMAMSWVYVHAGLPAGQNYRTLGVDSIISGCEYIRKYIAETMGLPSRVIRAGIDSVRFRPAARKILQIACMPHKNKTCLDNVERAFRSQFPQFQDVPFIRLENVSHDEVADRLAESAVFLSTGLAEGIARPVLEAMACECLVVAFHGRGGLEYMRNRDNCYVVPDADMSGASNLLVEAIRRFQSGDDVIQRSARATALLYSMEREEQEVLGYWNDFFRNGVRLP